eukprot:Gb_12499 [translate_table: standard]
MYGLHSQWSSSLGTVLKSSYDRGEKIKGRRDGGHGRAEGGRGGHDGARQGTRDTNRPRGGLCKLTQVAGEMKSCGEQRIATGGQGRPREDARETGRPREDGGSHKGHWEPQNTQKDSTRGKGGRQVTMRAKRGCGDSSSQKMKQGSQQEVVEGLRIPTAGTKGSIDLNGDGAMPNTKRGPKKMRQRANPYLNN